MSHIEESQECIFHFNNNMDFKIPLSSSASYEMETKFHVSSKFKVLMHTTDYRHWEIFSGITFDLEFLKSQLKKTHSVNNIVVDGSIVEFNDGLILPS
jgi:hypothetical protein